MLKQIEGGVGLGLRRDMVDDIISYDGAIDVDFWEMAPENWMVLGGRYEQFFTQLSQRYPLTSHGLSLSIGSPDPIDMNFVQQIRHFLQRYGITLYSEHLSFCSAHGHLYDLLPIPFCDDAIKVVAGRIRQVQDVLEQPLILENISYYGTLPSSLTELEFICAVLSEADCQMLLDVNNVYVNSVNHHYDPYQFIASLPSERIVYGHIAGHDQYDETLLIDTHGNDIIEPVWALLEYAYERHGVFPTLLERDFDLPPLRELLTDVQRIRQVQLKMIQAKYVSA